MTTAELLARRDELQTEMTNAPAAKHETPWYRDRANALAFINRQLARTELAEQAAAWCGERPADDEVLTVDHGDDDELWWGEFGPTRFDHFTALAAE